jgi:antitoxin (DNA-binding transcriptional repressor) of toxin-antitoxin stability system
MILERQGFYFAPNTGKEGANKNRKDNKQLPTAEFTTVDLRKNLSDVIGRAGHGKEIIHVLRHGKRFAAVVPPDAAQFLEVILSVSGRKQLDLNCLNQVLGDEKQIKELKDRVKKLREEEQSKETPIFSPTEKK